MFLMIIYFGADHRGFKLKEYLKNFLKNHGYETADLGNSILDETDNYPDFAVKVATKVSIDYENSRGVLICGSGVGMAVIANKFMKVRAALVSNPDQAYDSRNDADSNILVLAADYISEEEAKKILEVWLTTPFSNEQRHRERLQQISQIEFEILKPVQNEEEEI